MCPSYMVTKEEMHSTRGRTHLLFEMFQGDPMKQGWKSDAVREALDLCLACKGCRTECPMNVDMATYKAEFLSHYYERRLRPRHAYAMGWIYYPGNKEGHRLTRRASKGSGGFSSLARRVAMRQHAELPCRGNTGGRGWLRSLLVWRTRSRIFRSSVRR